AQAEANRTTPPVFITARLFPDMLAWARQVQIASDAAKGCTARLAGAEVPSYPDTETTFPELQARIAKTVDFVKGFNATQIDGSEERTCVLKIRGEDMKFR